MSDARGQTFSDAWHRVAGLRAVLRPDVRARRQSGHGKHWYVLSNPLSNEFFRISEDAYAFVSRLAADRTVEEVWRDTLAHGPESMLSQQEVVQLLGQLNLSNMLQADRANAGGSLFGRYRERRARERRARLMSVLSFRIPLFDPDRLLERALPLIRSLISPVGLVAYLVLLGLGAKALMDRGDELFDQAAGLLAPSNLALLYLGFVIAKVVHEFGHAAVCKRFGGEVHSMGVMLLLFAPLPYVDASASWGFRRSAPRLLVGAAGVLAELAVAAVAAMVWAYSDPGLTGALAYNVIFAASVSTLVFNLNPLLRFDGYHMLVDVINMPNLFQRSREQLRYLGQRYLLGVQQLKPVAQSRTEAWLLPLYGATSALYALVLMATIAFFVAEQYLDLGLLLALLLVTSATVLPLFKLLRHLVSSPQLAHQRVRAMASAVALTLAGFALLAWLPVPDRVRAAGVVESSVFRQLSSESAGFLHELWVKPGSRVSAGQALLRLENPDSVLEIQASRMQLQQIQAQELRAQALALADLAPLRQQRLAAGCAEVQGRDGVEAAEGAERAAINAGRRCAADAFAHIDPQAGSASTEGTVAATAANEPAKVAPARLSLVEERALRALNTADVKRARGSLELMLKDARVNREAHWEVRALLGLALLCQDEGEPSAAQDYMDAARRKLTVEEDRRAELYCLQVRTHALAPECEDACIGT